MIVLALVQSAVFMVCCVHIHLWHTNSQKKGKKILVHPNTVYLVFINNPFNEYKLLIEVFQ